MLLKFFGADRIIKFQYLHNTATYWHNRTTWKYHICQGYSNGGPWSESGPLDGAGRTSSASQTFILYPKVFIPKSRTFGHASKNVTPLQLYE